MRANMYAWLIVNSFLQHAKYDEIHDFIVKSCFSRGVSVDVKTNSDIINIFYADFENIKKPDFIIFWDKDVRMAALLEKSGFRVYNSARAIEICDDKSLTYLTLLNNKRVKQPKTIIAPKTFSNIGYTSYDFLKIVEDELKKYPIVVKECFGSFGAQVYLAENFDELLKIVAKIGSSPMLFQEFITTSRGRDIRLEIVGGQAITAMARTSRDGDFRANVTNGADMEKYSPNKEEIEMAAAACKECGLDFGGVDILFGENNEPVICEINSNAHFKNIYDCTGVNTADYIIDYILDGHC